MNHFHINLDYLSSLVKTAQEQVPTQEKTKDPLAQIIQMALGTACTIYIQQGSQRWTGSGFHIGDGIIATASHVVPPELKHSQAQIGITFGDDLLPATLLASDPTIDSALLHCAHIENNVPKVLLGDSDTAEVGDEVTVISSPEGWQGTATAGRITNIHQSMGKAAPTPAWNDIIFIDASILQGSSGGMVLGTDGLVYGSVMGVTGQHAEIGIGENSICPSNKIWHLLQSTKSHHHK